MDKKKELAIELLFEGDEIECSKKLGIRLSTLLSWMNELEFSAKLSQRSLIYEDASRRISKSALLNAIKSLNSLIMSGEVDARLLIEIIKQGDGFKETSDCDELSEVIKRIIADGNN